MAATKAEKQYNKWIGQLVELKAIDTVPAKYNVLFVDGPRVVLSVRYPTGNVMIKLKGVADHINAGHLQLATGDVKPKARTEVKEPEYKKLTGVAKATFPAPVKEPLVTVSIDKVSPFTKIKSAISWLFNEPVDTTEPVVAEVVIDNEFTFDKWDLVLTGCDTFSTFEKQIIAHTRLTDVGYMFEIFCEYLLKSNSVNMDIGIRNYTHIPVHEDIGVDGYGIGPHGGTVTVQMKHSKKSELTDANTFGKLARFAALSFGKFNIGHGVPNSMIIMTSAQTVAPAVLETILNNQAKVIGFNEISLLVDNNMLFWDGFREQILKSKEVINEAVNAEVN